MGSDRNDHRIISWKVADPQDVSIYLHIPFCEQKCIYCDFYSVVSFSLWETFLQQLQREIGLWAAVLAPYQPIRVRTMFWGGGTPSLLTPQQAEQIYQWLAETFDLTVLEEWTVECNPESVSREKLQGYFHLGVNRLSFGVQSLSDEALHFLGRIHSAQTAEHAVAIAKAVGFSNINVDLIFGVPGQTAEEWQRTLEQVVQWKVPHLSTYALTYERGTPLYTLWQNSQVEKISDEDEAQLYLTTAAMLAAAGYIHYEVSNFALPGYQCQHNLRYWERKEYLGLGPSAHGFLGNRRYANRRSLQWYCQRLEQDHLPIVSIETLSTTEIVEELVYLGFRAQGVDLRKLQAASGISVEPIAAAMVQQYPQYCYLDGNRLRLTTQGYAVADTLVLAFLQKLQSYSTQRHQLPVVL